jgi:hypothetical protein
MEVASGIGKLGDPVGQGRLARRGRWNGQTARTGPCQESRRGKKGAGRRTAQPTPAGNSGGAGAPPPHLDQLPAWYASMTDFGMRPRRSPDARADEPIPESRGSPPGSSGCACPSPAGADHHADPTHDRSGERVRRRGPRPRAACRCSRRTDRSHRHGSPARGSPCPPPPHGCRRFRQNDTGIDGIGSVGASLTWLATGC